VKLSCVTNSFEAIKYTQLLCTASHTVRGFYVNLCKYVYCAVSLFRVYLPLPWLHLLAFHHSLRFVTIVPDAPRLSPELCSFECSVPTVISEHTKLT
jgi:hypothetical protein